MQPQVCHFPQPTPDLSIGGRHIQLKTRCLEASGQRHVKGAAQIAIETLNLALGPGPVGLAQLWLEPVMPGEIEESRLEAMLPWPIGIALDDHSLHVVVEGAAWHAAKPLETIRMAH